MNLMHPAIHLMNRLNYARKFLLLSVVVVMPLLWISYKTISNGDIVAARNELVGSDYVMGLRSLLQHCQQHRGLSSSFLIGTSSHEEVKAKQSEIEKDFRVIDDLQKKSESLVNAAKKWGAIESGFSAIVTNLQNATPKDNFDANCALCEAIIDFIGHIGNTSGLILDPEASTYHVAYLILYPVPEVSEYLGQIRARGMMGIKKKSLSNDDRVALQTLIALARDRWKSVMSNLQVVRESGDSFPQSLESEINAADKACRAYFETIEKQFLNDGAVSISSTDYWTLSTSTIDRLFSFYDNVIPWFNTTLTTRVSDLSWQRNVVVLSSIGALAALSYLFAGMYLSIIGSIKMVNAETTRMESGTADSNFKLDCKDELSAIGNLLNRINSALMDARALKLRVEADKQRLERSVDSILTVVNAARQGDLTQNVSVRGSDAIGQLGEGIDALINDLNENMSQITQNASSLASASEELSATAQQMASNSEETTSQATTVSAASEEVSKNVQTVATGSEEMSASIREIAKNASESAKVASIAVKTAENTTRTISKLGDSSAEVGKIIKVITSIAQQTNLLALNATIEAARAGEAGKGFAVVANEVKELAKETAKATEDISRKIEAIQSDTGLAVTAIREIGNVINQINEISSSIASAVEEQSATTNEIGRNVAEAAKGVGDITQNITGVAKAAQETSVGANDSKRAATSLAEMANNLQLLVSRFQLKSSDSIVLPKIQARITDAGHSNRSHIKVNRAARYTNGKHK